MKFSQYIKDYRKKNNLTQQELANKLYVTKQTISKWENDKGIPDVSLYQSISNLLDVSIDELMGNEKKSVKKKNYLIISLIGVVVLLLLITITIVIINNNSKTITDKKIIEKTENYLGTKLPKIIEYNYIDFESWQKYNNSSYPNELYYFVFKNEIINVDQTWMSELPENIKDNLPLIATEYLKTSDYYKIVNTKNKDINHIEIEPNKYNCYILYCLQISNKRLIAITFEV